MTPSCKDSNQLTFLPTPPPGCEQTGQGPAAAASWKYRECRPGEAGAMGLLSAPASLRASSASLACRAQITSARVPVSVTAVRSRRGGALRGACPPTLLYLPPAAPPPT